MEPWIPILVALVALLGGVAAQRASRSLPKEHLEALEAISKAISVSEGVTKQRLKAAEAHLAKRIEVRYREYTWLGAALIGILFSAAGIGVLAAAGALILQLASEANQYTFLVGPLIAATIACAALVVIAAVFLVFMQFRQSKKLDGSAGAES